MISYGIKIQKLKKQTNKKTVMIKKYIEGGMNMINLNAFVSVFKSTWIRRLLLNESKWQEVVKIHINLEMLTSCRLM